MSSEIRFAMRGTFEQLSYAKQEAEKVGWNYVKECHDFNIEEYRDRDLYFSDKQTWSGKDGLVINGFSLSYTSECHVFDLDKHLQDVPHIVKSLYTTIKKKE